MKEAQIVLAALPQSDGQVKNRPVLILKEMPGYGDFLVSGISAQLHQEVKNWDEKLIPNSVNNLKEESIIRLSFLSTLSKHQMKGAIGEVPNELHLKLIAKLANYLKK